MLAIHRPNPLAISSPYQIPEHVLKHSSCRCFVTLAWRSQLL